MWLGEYGFSLTATLAGVVYPLFHSFKALKEDRAPEWLPYWLVFVLFSTVAYPLDLFFSAWLPLYYELKLGFIVALQPATLNGAKILYDTRLEPALLELDNKLTTDPTILAVQARWEKFMKLSLQDKWALLKDLDIGIMTSTVASAKAYLGVQPKASLAKAPPANASTKAEAKSEGLPPVPPPESPEPESPEPESPEPESPANPNLNGSSDDAEIVEPEDVPAAYGGGPTEPITKKTQ